MSTTNTITLEDIEGGGAPAFKFENIGDTLKGEITNLATNQARDFKSKEPATFKDGNPIMQIVVTIRHEDGEEYRIFARKPSAMLAAISEAVKEAGASGVTEGGRLLVKLASFKPTDMSPQKIYEVKYKAPEPSTISEDDI